MTPARQGYLRNLADMLEIAAKALREAAAALARIPTPTDDSQPLGTLPGYASLSVRLSNRLYDNDILTVKDLCAMTDLDLALLPQFGEKMLRELREKLLVPNGLRLYGDRTIDGSGDPLCDGKGMS